MSDYSTVYVVQSVDKINISDAKRFGTFSTVFKDTRKPYNTLELVSKARSALENWKPGDYLLVIGDPTLAAVCMSVLNEKHDVVAVLSWDRQTFEYIPQVWDFSVGDDEFVSMAD